MTIDTALLDALIAATPDPGGYWTKETLQELKANFSALADSAGLPAVGDNGDVLTVVGGTWTAAVPATGLPAVGDNGDVLTVVGGNWVADKPATGLPPISSAAETLVLTVVGGTTTATWAQGTPGPAGSQGPPGTNGTNGSDGADGGFNSVQTIKPVGSSYTLAMADAGALIKITAGAQITVPSDSTANFDAGQHIDLVSYTGSGVTIAAAGGVTLRAPYGAKFKVQYGTATLVKMGANEWLLIGDMEEA